MKYLITGVAGFIVSLLVETLPKQNQTVSGLDNFFTGHQNNLVEVRGLVSSEQWQRFRFIEDSICYLEYCKEACSGADLALHQGALGSVPS